ncbi:DUF4230 domain-containing protein [Oscillatoriales cyanobacterium LEGE 11467]|uniref:DUF4230 domain-containing protein n=1 Tax=Zarconia navalis LEGE 11467 TaxID=1828826 RepID=A0A928VVB7_9CYAN|nr:DUF4230 domain-containing protein [Zarconia navalis]MBE9040917.1 DUF4230 domain-containing protein [Zarconia navalis LEGE 11467]
MNALKIAKAPVKILFHPLVLSSAVVTAAVLGMSGWFARFPAAFLPQVQPSATDVKSLLVDRLEGSTELQTARVSLETVVVANQERTLGQWRLGETKVVYQGVGQVSAGIDMSKLQVVEVDRNRGEIQILLPPPYLVNTSLDIERSGILDHRKDWLGPNVSTNLHDLAQREALDQIRSQACQKGLLNMANEQARELVETILIAARYEEIEVATQSPEPSTCPSG